MFLPSNEFYLKKSLSTFQRTAPSFLVRFIAFFHALARWSVPGLDKKTLYDNSRMKQVLGITPRDITNSLIDTIYSMIENGMVKKTDKYKGRQ